VILSELSGDHFCTAIMIGHVKSIEAACGIAGHRGTGCNRIDGLAVFLHIGDLPQAVHDPPDFQTGSE